MTTRHAACSCGQLTVTVTGEPVRISMCHCLACQRRTGSLFGAQARWPRDRVTIEGRSTAWTRTADSGMPIESHFCPVCGSTVWYRQPHIPEIIAVTTGSFADPDFPMPRFSVWRHRRHPWLALPDTLLDDTPAPAPQP
jgi:hypothetical protein